MIIIQVFILFGMCFAVYIGMKTQKKRYLAITKQGKILAWGKLLGDVQSFGERIIIDYKLMRFAIENIYPTLRPVWHHTGFKNIRRYMA